MKLGRTKGVNIILDGDHLIHRHMYQPGLRKLSNEKGIPTGALMGVLNQLNLMFYSTSRPVEAIYFFVGGGSCKWRREIYPDYKAKDPGKREEFKSIKHGERFSSLFILKQTMAALQIFLPALGVRYIYYDGYEADEVAYFTAYRLNMIGREYLAVSEDDDWLQHVKLLDTPVYRPIKDETITRQNFDHFFNFPVDGITLYLAMIGGHDNIPKALNNFGAKRIAWMLQELPEFTLEAIKQWGENQTPGSLNAKVKSPEVLKTIDRNLKLVDFSRAPLTNKLKKHIDFNIKQKPKYNSHKVEKLLDYYELNELKENLKRDSFRTLR